MVAVSSNAFGVVFCPSCGWDADYLGQGFSCLRHPVQGSDGIVQTSCAMTASFHDLSIYSLIPGHLVYSFLTSFNSMLTYHYCIAFVIVSVYDEAEIATLQCRVMTAQLQKDKIFSHQPLRFVCKSLQDVGRFCVLPWFADSVDVHSI